MIRRIPSRLFSLNNYAQKINAKLSAKLENARFVIQELELCILSDAVHSVHRFPTHVVVDDEVHFVSKCHLLAVI